MKWSILVFFLASGVAWPQVRSGTLVFLSFDEDEVTISADSRMLIFGGGVSSHADTECKISAFGKQFIFAGTVSGQGWSAHTIARQAWEKRLKDRSDPTGFVHDNANDWATTMDRIYRDPTVILNRVRFNTEVMKDVDTGALANAFL